MIDIPVCFENDDCVILNKPAGLAVQGGKGVGISLDSILEELWSPRPLLVHRLDKDTSGLILVAKHKQAAARFAALFAEGAGSKKISKQYLAICAGRPQADSGIIRLDLDIRGTMKWSETRYKRLGGTEDFSVLELELHTGRMHQIRRHLAHLGHPILGDDKYGNFTLNKKLRKTQGLKQLLLHASRLIIKDDACPVDITAPLPAYFAPFCAFFP